MLKFSLQSNQRAGADCHWHIRQFPLSSLLTLQRYYLAKAKSRKRRIVNTIVLAIDAEMRLKRLYIIRYKALFPLPFSVGSDEEWEQSDCGAGIDWQRYGSRLSVKWAQSNFEVRTYCPRIVPPIAAECPCWPSPDGHNKHHEISLHFVNPIFFLSQL